ncbi:MAG TPA: hypothetical protein VFJ58_00630, partial [Armatimonadota bacterium]|nr:hypothetical protein [Armatimonadota bacterium]
MAIDPDELEAPASGVSAPVVGEEEVPAMEMNLEAYLRSNDRSELTPLLLGTTGVAKSSFIKSMCDRLGYRLVDYQCAFMSRLDPEGPFETKGVSGYHFSFDAPDARIIECTDEYITFCRAAVPIIQARIDDLKARQVAGETTITQVSPEDEEARILRKSSGGGLSTREAPISDHLEGLGELLADYQEKSKIPVLFLDEFTRATSNVMSTFLRAQTSGKFGGCSLKMARIVAAASFPIGIDPSLADLHAGKEMYDVNLNIRFEKYPIKPLDVYPRWIKWASQDNPGAPVQKNIYPDVLKFIHDHIDLAAGTSYAYYSQPVIDVISEGGDAALE